MAVNWRDCLENRDAKSIHEDQDLIKSLLITSKNKEFSANALKLMDETAVSKISLAYDSVRELLEAWALNAGFKIYNHVCYTSFLREVIRDGDLAVDFDELRIIRNDINYNGKQISLKEADHVLRRLSNLRKKISGKINEKF